MIKQAISSLPLLALAIAGVAQAEPNEYEEVVQAQIFAMAVNVAGIDPDADPIDYFDGTIGAQDAAYLDLPVYPNRTYALLAACDQDCSDIDVYVDDSDGTEVASDNELDDVPVVIFSTERNTSYQARVRMYDCSTSICYYGAVLFEITN